MIMTSTPTITPASAYDLEQDAIAALTAGMKPGTRDLVRKAIQRALDQGKTLDRLSDEWREVDRLITGLPPCERVGGCTDPTCRYCRAVAEEGRVTGRIANVKRMLGVRL